VSCSRKAASHRSGVEEAPDVARQSRWPPNDAGRWPSNSVLTAAERARIEAARRKIEKLRRELEAATRERDQAILEPYDRRGNVNEIAAGAGIARQTVQTIVKCLADRW
jgi:hypothetical protein